MQHLWEIAEALIRAEEIHCIPLELWAALPPCLARIPERAQSAVTPHKQELVEQATILLYPCSSAPLQKAGSQEICRHPAPFLCPCCDSVRGTAHRQLLMVDMQLLTAAHLRLCRLV